VVSPLRLVSVGCEWEGTGARCARSRFLPFGLAQGRNDSQKDKNNSKKQIPRGNDRKKGKNNNKKQIPRGNDRKKGKSNSNYKTNTGASPYAPRASVEMTEGAGRILFPTRPQVRVQMGQPEGGVPGKCKRPEGCSGLLRG
jgi:hypothetical protein